MVKMYYVVDEWVVNIVEPLEVAYVLSLFILTRKSISRIWMNYVLQCQHKHYNETGGGLIWLIYQVLLEEIFLICLKME